MKLKLLKRHGRSKILFEKSQIDLLLQQWASGHADVCLLQAAPRLLLLQEALHVGVSGSPQGQGEMGL